MRVNVAKLIMDLAEYVRKIISDMGIEVKSVEISSYNDYVEEIPCLEVRVSVDSAGNLMKLWDVVIGAVAKRYGEDILRKINISLMR